jgi:hypothetical protein
MAEKKVYRFSRPLSGQKKNRGLWTLPQPSALTTALSRRSGRSSALPYPPFECGDSTMRVHLYRWMVFRCEFLTSKCPSGRFFVIKVVGFSIDKYTDGFIEFCLASLVTLE